MELCLSCIKLSILAPHWKFPNCRNKNWIESGPHVTDGSWACHPNLVTTHFTLTWQIAIQRVIRSHFWTLMRPNCELMMDSLAIRANSIVTIFRLYMLVNHLWDEVLAPGTRVPWKKRPRHLFYTKLFNSLATGRFEQKFRSVIFKLISVTDGWGISCKIALRWMLLDLTDKSTLVQVMAWCHQATSHYLSQCWPRFMSRYGVTRPQWVNYHMCTSMSSC